MSKQWHYQVAAVSGSKPAMLLCLTALRRTPGCNNFKLCIQDSALKYIWRLFLDWYALSERQTRRECSVGVNTKEDCIACMSLAKMLVLGSASSIYYMVAQFATSAATLSLSPSLQPGACNLNMLQQQRSALCPLAPMRYIKAEIVSEGWLST